MANRKTRHLVRIFILLSIALLLIPILTSCSTASAAPTKDQCRQAILNFIRTNKNNPDYNQYLEAEGYLSMNDVLVSQIGESETLGNPPNQFLVWPVRATVFRNNTFALDNRVFLICKNSFGEWAVPAQLQVLVPMQYGLP